MGAYGVRTDGGGYLFDEDLAVAEMLPWAVVLLGEGDGGQAEVTINLNDLFVPGADDAPLMFDHIEPLYVAFCDPRPNALREWLCELIGDRPWRERE